VRFSGELCPQRQFNFCFSEIPDRLWIHVLELGNLGIEASLLAQFIISTSRWVTFLGARVKYATLFNSSSEDIGKSPVAKVI
jgi:hypothetical protein